MKRFSVMLAFVCAVAMTQGCSRAISEGIEKVLGPTGKILPMEPKWPEKDSTYLAAYQNIELAPLKSEFPDTPAQFMSYFPMKFGEQLASKGLPAGRGGKTLLVHVDIVAYQPVSSYNKALGPTEEVVARVELIDKDSGKLIGKAMAIGRTYQSVGLGPKWKAWGLARAIVNEWINGYYPKEGRHEAEEQAPPAEDNS